MAEGEKALPTITQDNEEFWKGCKRHELLIQKCQDCRRYRMYPQPMCPECGSMKAKWKKVTGRGKIYSFVIIRYSAHPLFKDKVPYAVVLVELDDAQGIRIFSNIIGCEPEKIKIGMPVEVVFEDITGEITIPKFKPIS